MKICLYSPYVPTSVGGGEKYIFDVARILTQKHQVFFAIANFNEKEVDSIKKKYESFLNYSLDKIDFINTPINTNSSFYEKTNWTAQFDCLYYVTDGSVFFSRAKKNILHIQIPLKIKKNSLLEKVKLKNWQIKNTNSYFTKSIVEKYWKVKIDLVHQPMIDFSALNKTSSSFQKEKIILHVGRFFKQLHNKKQEVLVEMFKQMRERNPDVLKNWQLILIGSDEDEVYSNQIKQLAKNLPIKIIHDVNKAELIKYYQKASIYWHATGYGIDEMEYPEKMEHFGISTVEAMAAGCAPVVIKKGGQKEIMTGPLQQWLWDTKDDCINKTLRLISDAKLRHEVSIQAVKRSKDFDGREFETKLWQMIND